MLWLAGLMGLMAVGAVAFVDPQTNGDEEDDFVDPSTSDETLPSAIAANVSFSSQPEDNFEPDYDVEDDSIVLVWDDSAAGSLEPRITLSVDPDSADQTLIMIDGAVVATVNGSDLVPGDIALIPLSTATQVGLSAV